MKYLALLLFSLLFFSSCKKYEDDDFISTYSPLERLTASSGQNVYWVLVGYTDEVGNDVAVPPNLYNLRFGGSGQLYLQWAPYLKNYTYVPSESYSSNSEWSFDDNKDKLIFFGVEHNILKLSVTELVLKNSLGAIYTFKKQPTALINNMEDAVSPIPFLGVIPINTIEYHKLVWSNSLNSQSGITLEAQAAIAWTTDTEPVLCSVQSSTLLGTAYVSDNPNTVSAKCTFSRYFAHYGYLTFFFRKSNGGMYFNEWPQIMVNDVTTEYFYDSTPYDDNPNWGWYKAIVPVNLTGNISFQITGTYKVANGIDEIRQWERLN